LLSLRLSREYGVLKLASALAQAACCRRDGIVIVGRRAALGQSGGKPPHSILRYAPTRLPPCRPTISLIQIGANGDVQPFEVG